MTIALDAPPTLRNEVWRGLVWIDKDEEEPLYRVELVGAVVRPTPPDPHDFRTVLARNTARHMADHGERLPPWEQALLTGDWSGVRLPPPEANLWLPPQGNRTDATWGLVCGELAALVFAAWAEAMAAVAEAERALREASDETWYRVANGRPTAEVEEAAHAEAVALIALSKAARGMA